MSSNTKNRHHRRLRRKIRVRKKVSGSPARPRLVVFRSNRHIYAQVVDDEAGRTVASASTLQDRIGQSLTRETAGRVGALVAERSKAAGVEKVVFDRGGYQYHGRVKALADAARESGLEF